MHEEVSDHPPQHIEFSVGKIDHVHQAENGGETYGDQGVDAPDDEPVNELLDEDHFLH